jgi:hypothetical protein
VIPLGVAMANFFAPFADNFADVLNNRLEDGLRLSDTSAAGEKINKRKNPAPIPQ